MNTVILKKFRAQYDYKSVRNYRGVYEWKVRRKPDGKPRTYDGTLEIRLRILHALVSRRVSSKDHNKIAKRLNKESYRYAGKSNIYAARYAVKYLNLIRNGYWRLFY